jgi:NTE family protein
MPENDDLPLPYDLAAQYGAGHNRALVLGGGGIFFIAWQVVYLHELAKRGVQLGNATLVVGTSAGSVVASLATAGRIGLARAQLEVLAKVPSVMSAMAPATGLRQSQQRALALFRDATDAAPDTIRTIGHAALAADASPAGRLRRSLTALVSTRGWPSEALAVTTVDTFTGERLVIRSGAQVSAARAAAASSSVPGLFSPQPVGDRRCMDGGVSGTGTHADLTVGAERVVILSLSAHTTASEPMMTIRPDSLPNEIDAVRRAGGEVFVRGPLEADLATLMSPSSVPAAVAMATRQASDDADVLGRFWG